VTQNIHRQSVDVANQKLGSAEAELRQVPLWTQLIIVKYTESPNYHVTSRGLPRCSYDVTEQSVCTLHIYCLTETVGTHWRVDHSTSNTTITGD
jgi:hypothetical protein